MYFSYVAMLGWFVFILQTDVRFDTDHTEETKAGNRVLAFKKILSSWKIWEATEMKLKLGYKCVIFKSFGSYC